MELTETQREALAAIVGGPLAWSTAKALARRGHGAETFEALEVAGLVERWELPRETAWTLTPYGAWTLGVEIVEDGFDENPRWGYPADVLKFRHVYRQRGHYALKFPEIVRATTPAPDYLIDPISEEPLMLFNRLIPIDNRMRRKVERLIKADAKKAERAKAKRKAKKPKGAATRRRQKASA